MNEIRKMPVQMATNPEIRIYKCHHSNCTVGTVVQMTTIKLERTLSFRHTCE